MRLDWLLQPIRVYPAQTGWLTKVWVKTCLVWTLSNKQYACINPQNYRRLRLKVLESIKGMQFWNVLALFISPGDARDKNELILEIVLEGKDLNFLTRFYL